jgi:hypothetical protein
MEGTVEFAGGRPAQRWTATRTVAAKVMVE